MMMGHWRRLIVQLLLLGGMFAINAISTEAYVGAIIIAIIILPAASWTVFGLLLWTSSQAKDIRSLADRVDDALTMALVSTVAAVVGLATLARILGFITTPIGGLVTVGLGFIVVEVSIPAIGFLRTWRDVYLPVVQQRRGELPSQGDADSPS